MRIHTRTRVCVRGALWFHCTGRSRELAERVQEDSHHVKHPAVRTPPLDEREHGHALQRGETQDELPKILDSSGREVDLALTLALTLTLTLTLARTRTLTLNLTPDP